ncbi:MAG TPA: SxtJ family membrane protein [Candidatus Polarisedimenticolia bacterium]|nr:SxtJ family membrane protein [Candidatus Polarisedimenticolia bacterium]
MEETVPSKTLRSFGLLVGGVWGLIGLWPLVWRREPPRLWALGLMAVLVGLGLVFPQALRQPYRGWMALGHALGWINTRILLGLVFYLLVTPMGFVMRLFGRDPMRRGFDASAKTYRIGREARPGSHMRHQF